MGGPFGKTEVRLELRQDLGLMRSGRGAFCNLFWSYKRKCKVRKGPIIAIYGASCQQLETASS
jgi:hypothetical protein